MSLVFDPRPYIAERELQEPIPTSDPAQFPHEEYVPEGTHLLTGLKDEWGRNVDMRRTIYKVKSHRQLEMIVLVPVDLDPDEDNKWPCVVYSQGSAFHEEWLCNNLVRHIRLASAGYVVAIAQYRPSENAPFPAQAQDVKSAIRFIRKNAELFNVDPEHIAVAGDSSGGHTSLMVGFTGDGVLDDGVYGDVSCQVNCIVDCYGPTVFSLMNYWPSSQNHWDPKSPEGYEIGVKNVLENLDESDKTIPMNYLSEDKPTPPTLIINGSRDMLVPASQSALLYETMKKMGKEAEYYRIVDGNHGFIGWNNDTILNIVLDFLKEHI